MGNPYGMSLTGQINIKHLHGKYMYTSEMLYCEKGQIENSSQCHDIYQFYTEILSVQAVEIRCKYS